MSRSISASGLAGMFAQETDVEYVVILQLDHDLLSTGPIRVARSNRSIYTTACSSDGTKQEFIAFPFGVDLPSETEDEMPRSVLQIGNVDRRVVQGVREVNSPIDVTMHVLSGTSTDFTIEAGPWVFKLRDVEYDDLVVSGDLRFEDWLNEPSPADAFTPSKVPGIFRSA